MEKDLPPGEGRRAPPEPRSSRRPRFSQAPRSSRSSRPSARPLLSRHGGGSRSAPSLSASQGPRHRGGNAPAWALSLLCLRADGSSGAFQRPANSLQRHLSSIATRDGFSSPRPERRREAMTASSEVSGKERVRMENAPCPLGGGTLGRRGCSAWAERAKRMAQSRPGHPYAGEGLPASRAGASFPKLEAILRQPFWTPCQAPRAGLPPPSRTSLPRKAKPQM